MREAEPGSEEEDRLDVLATLIEAYEEKRQPILPPDPEEAILIDSGPGAVSPADSC